MHWRDFQRQQRVRQIGPRFVSYIDAGQGTPVVLLHGIPTWGFLWHRQIEGWARAHRVLAPDLLGFGYSDKSDRFDRSIERQAAMVDAWMAELGVARAAVVGHDIGGGVALRLATLFPDRVERLCVMNTVCYDSWPVELMLQLGHPAANRKLSAGRVQLMLRTALRQGFASSPDKHTLEGLLAPYHTEIGKLSLIRNAAALNTNLTTDIVERMPRIRVPVMVLWGEEDKFQPVEYGERLVSDIPGAELARIKDARHFVMLDQPAAVEEAVGRFLTG